MQNDAVHVYRWMTNAQFLTAVALGRGLLFCRGAYFTLRVEMRVLRGICDSVSGRPVRRFADSIGRRRSALFASASGWGSRPARAAARRVSRCDPILIRGVTHWVAGSVASSTGIGGVVVASRVSLDRRAMTAAASTKMLETSSARW